MVNRLALFVEGGTEVEFAARLVKEIAHHQGVLIDVEKTFVRGGKRVPKVFEFRGADDGGDCEYYVLIVNCQGDGQVAQRILDEHQGLTDKGFSKILGLRDVRPAFQRLEIPRLEVSLRGRIRSDLIPVEFILSVMEIEAWFLAETTHFPRIAPAVTVQAIAAALGFDPGNQDMQERDHPAADLDRRYRLGGKSYAKKDAGLTIDALDFERVRTSLIDRFPHLEVLVHSITAFLSRPGRGSH